MYRAFLFIALLAFCSAAPYSSGWTSAGSASVGQGPSWAQQPTGSVRVQQQDDTDLVDTLGAGYSFFKKQPIVSRPLIQQKLAINEQQAPITSLDDTSDQWSGYTQSSAFNQQSVQVPTRLVNKDLLVGGGYGQQQQQQPLSRNLGNSYGQQQQQQLPIVVPQLQKTLSRDLGNSYGQQQQEIPTFVPQQQPLVRNLGNSYGQQQQQEIPTFVPQQQTLVRDLGNSYGQQQQQQELPTFVSQQQPLVRNLGNSYGQQQQESQVVVPQLQKTLSRDLGNSYGQQQQQLPTFVPQQQPLVRDLGNSYGPQAQSIFNDVVSDGGYGQQQSAVSSVQLAQPTLSQQTTLSRGASSIIPSSHFISRSQPVVQKTNSGSYSDY